MRDAKAAKNHRGFVPYCTLGERLSSFFKWFALFRATAILVSASLSAAEETGAEEAMRRLACGEPVRDRHFTELLSG